MGAVDTRTNWRLPQSRPRNLFLKSIIVAALVLIVARTCFAAIGARIWYTENHRLLQSSNSDFLTAQSGSQRSKIGKIFMQYGPENPMNERGIATHLRHNDNFGYSTSVLRTQTMKQYWSKPAYIQKVLLAELEKPSAERLEWVYWFDSDIVLMNPKIPLELFLPPPGRKWAHINAIVTQDHRGLNNGVFALRVNSWSVWLMSSTLSTKHFMPNLKLRIGDQSAMEYWVQADIFRKSVMHVPQRWINAYAGYRGIGNFSDPALNQTTWRANSIQEGDLLVHHAGHKELRAGLMEPWLATAEQHLPKWEVDLERSTLPQEVEEFWSHQASDEWNRVERFRKKSGYEYLS